VPAARAEDRNADAERLFREAQPLLEARDFANACPKLERAFALDSKLGTLINLAFCHKAQETWWLAWLEFRHAEVMAVAQKRSDRRDFVRAQLTEIERRAKLSLVIVDNPRGEPLTEVLVEDRKVPEAEAGSVFMVEPTTTVDRKFTFLAKGKKSVDKLVRIPRSDKTVQHVPVPQMENEDAGAPNLPLASTPLPVSARKATAGDEPSPDAAREGGGSRGLLGWGLVGLGALGVGVGSYFGVKALGSGCAGTSARASCTPDVKRAGDRDALASTVTMAAGGAAAVGGLVVLLLEPSSARKSASASVAPALGLGTVGVRGCF
jgi:hypothetical protein